MDVIVVRGNEASRTSERLSKIAMRTWGRDAEWWIEHYPTFALILSRPYDAQRDVAYDVYTELSSGEGVSDG